MAEEGEQAGAWGAAHGDPGRVAAVTLPSCPRGRRDTGASASAQGPGTDPRRCPWAQRGQRRQREALRCRAQRLGKAVLGREEAAGLKTTSGESLM